MQDPFTTTDKNKSNANNGKKRLIGDIVERSPSSDTAFNRTRINKEEHEDEGVKRTGFPSVFRRNEGTTFGDGGKRKSRSVFGRERGLTSDVETFTTPLVKSNADANINMNMTEEEKTGETNASIVASMTDSEREEAKEEINRMFGDRLVDFLKSRKRSDAVVVDEIEGKSNGDKDDGDDDDDSDDEMPELEDNWSFEDSAVTAALALDNPHSRPITPPHPARSPLPSILVSASRPRSRSRSLSPENDAGTMTPNTKRRLRFADVTDEDVHIYERVEGEKSPRKIRGILLPPPPQTSETPATPTVTTTSETNVDDDKNKEDTWEEEEGSAEYIRKRYFPNEGRNNSALEWITKPLPSSAAAAQMEPESGKRLLSTLRFTLAGQPILRSESHLVPRHLGLHHHANGVEAGYSVDDVLMLTRSAMAGQRGGMLSVLAKVVRFVGCHGDDDEYFLDAGNDVKMFRQVALGVSLDALLGSLTATNSTSNSITVSVAAIDVIWECLVNWGNGQQLELDEDELESEWSNELEFHNNKNKAIDRGIIDESQVRNLLMFIEAQFHFHNGSDNNGTGVNSTPRKSKTNPMSKLKPVPKGSLLHLLTIVIQLARCGDPFAKIVVLPNGDGNGGDGELVKAVIRCFLGSTTYDGEHKDESEQKGAELSLRLIKLLVLSSQENAKALVDEGVVDLATGVLVRTLGGVSSSLDQISLLRKRENIAMMTGTISKILDITSLLGIYDIYSLSAVRVLAERLEAIWEVVVRTVKINDIDGVVGTRSIAELILSFWRLMEVWIDSRLNVSANRSVGGSESSDTLWRYLSLYLWRWREIVRDGRAILKRLLTQLDSDHIEGREEEMGLDWELWASLWDVERVFEEAGLIGDLNESEMKEKNEMVIEEDDKIADSVLTFLTGWSCSVRDQDRNEGNEEKKTYALGKVRRACICLIAYLRVRIRTELKTRENMAVDEGKRLQTIKATVEFILELNVDANAKQVEIRVNGSGDKTRERREKSPYVFELIYSRYMLPIVIRYLEFSESGFEKFTGNRNYTLVGINDNEELSNRKLSEWLRIALRVVRVLGRGFEEEAWKIVGRVLDLIGESVFSVDISGEIDWESKTWKDILMPFLEFRIFGRLRDGEHDDDKVARRQTRSTSFPGFSHSSYSGGGVGHEEDIGDNNGKNKDGDLKKRKLSTGLPFIRNYTMIDWTMCALEHLMLAYSSGSRSASPILEKLREIRPVNENENVDRSSKGKWIFSDVDIVRASLALSVFVQKCLDLDVSAEDRNNDSDCERELRMVVGMSLEEVVYACMNIFMLQQVRGDDASEAGEDRENDGLKWEEELFRDDTVSVLMEELVRPYTIRVQRRRISGTTTTKSPEYRTLDQIYESRFGVSDTSTSSTEAAAAATMVPKTTTLTKTTTQPFYQFYTDFIEHYDNTSFSHRLFSRLLLVPISMRYPIDYRKYFWGEYGHVLRAFDIGLLPSPSDIGSNSYPSSINAIARSDGRSDIYPDEIICRDISEYLYPVERDAEMLGYYARALVVWKRIGGFLYWVAVHHVACNIWIDLDEDLEKKNENEEDRNPGDTTRRKRLFQAIFRQGNDKLIRDVLCYRQSNAQKVVFPPDCFVSSKSGPDPEESDQNESGLQSEKNEILSSNWKSARIDCVVAWEGEDARFKYENILVSSVSTPSPTSAPSSS